MANLIEQKMGFEEITTLIPAAEGRVSMTEVILRPGAPAVDHTLQELDLPDSSLVACIVRDGQVIVPRGNSLLYLADRLILVTLPQSHGQTLRALLGHDA